MRWIRPVWRGLTMAKSARRCADEEGVVVVMVVVVVVVISVAIVLLKV